MGDVPLQTRGCATPSHFPLISTLSYFLRRFTALAGTPPSLPEPFHLRLQKKPFWKWILLLQFFYPPADKTFHQTVPVTPCEAVALSFT